MLRYGSPPRDGGCKGEEELLLGGRATPGPPAREIKGLFNPARRIAGISRKISFSSHGVNGT